VHLGDISRGGEWFDLPLADAEGYVEQRLQRIGAWGVDHQTMINFMDQRTRQRERIPDEAPSPLRGWRDEQLPAAHLTRKYLSSADAGDLSRR
jgi:hypothetical protein